MPVDLFEYTLPFVDSADGTLIVTQEINQILVSCSLTL